MVPFGGLLTVAVLPPPVAPSSFSWEWIGSGSWVAIEGLASVRFLVFLAIPVPVRVEPLWDKKKELLSF